MSGFIGIQWSGRYLFGKTTYVCREYIDDVCNKQLMGELSEGCEFRVMLIEPQACCHVRPFRGISGQSVLHYVVFCWIVFRKMLLM